MQNVKISIIIPCFNHGEFVIEAIDSFITHNYPFNFEVFIINDGSTDEKTNSILSSIKKDNVHVINQNNSGPSVARNNGIKMANGTYILPLDGDNKILPNYLLKAVDLLDSNSEIDIVYGKGQRFGLSDNSLIGRPFNLLELVQYNTIDTCAVYRKKVWESVGGYDEYMSKKGLEDWEFWINCSEKKFKFHFLDEVLYYYRETEEARTFKVANKNLNELVQYVRQKHANFIVETLLMYKVQLNDALRSKEYLLGKTLLRPIRYILQNFR